ncbi:MAG: acyl-CoA dehydrogenase family protein [Alphaproteobacteria bacterium]
MDFTEPDHITQLREVLRRFVAQEMPRAEVARWDKADEFPRHIFEKLAPLGIFGSTIPEEYGGSGRDILATMVTIEELAKRSFPVAVSYINCACYGGMNILESGSEEQRRSLLPRLARGELLFAYGLTEPDVGADLASVKTTADRRGDVVVINGAKRFLTGAKIADYIYLLVRSDRNEPRYRNLSLLLVPSDRPGIDMTPIGTLGLKGFPSYDVTFEDVEIPSANIVGGEAGWNNGWSMLAGPTLDVEKLEVAAIGIGIAEAAIEDAWTYSQERQQFGKPVSAYQSIRHMLADARTKLHAARLMMYHAAWRADRRLPCGVESSMAKLFVTEMAKDIVLTCQTVLGAYGYAEGFDLERHVRDVLLLPIIGGSSAIQRNNIANRLGLPR